MYYSTTFHCEDSKIKRKGFDENSSLNINFVQEPKKEGQEKKRQIERKTNKKRGKRKEKKERNGNDKQVKERKGLKHMKHQFN